MTHPYVSWINHTWYASFIRDMSHSYVAWLIHMWLDSFMCDMTHSPVTWRIHMWPDAFMSESQWQACTLCIHRLAHQGSSFFCCLMHRMSLILHLWVITHANASCRIWMGQFLCSCIYWGGQGGEGACTCSGIQTHIPMKVARKYTYANRQ